MSNRPLPIEVAAAAGELLLRHGAEVKRVEDTMRRILSSYRVAGAHAVVFPTGLVVSADTAQGPYTAVRRVARRAAHLQKVAAVNALSRSLEGNPLPPDEVMRRLREIEAAPDPYSPWMRTLGGAMAGAALTLVIGGTPLDFVPAVWTNLAVQGIRRAAERLEFPDAVGEFLGGAVATGLALLLGAAGWAQHPSTVIAGGIMTMLPGSALTVAIRDGIAGDLLSSTSHMLEALVRAGAIAGGVSLALYLIGRGVSL